MIEDVQHVYEKGLGTTASRSSMPALAELAEALSPTPSGGEGDYYSEAIEAVLHRASSRVEDDDRRQGFSELFGIGRYKGGGVMRRREDAAPLFGLGSGESLRKDERGGRLVIEMLIEELADHLLALAEEANFFYSELMSWSTFYPERATYDYNSLSSTFGRYGAMRSGPVFNSFINTPSYGDERTFFDGRRSDSPKHSSYDPVRNVTRGDLLTLRIYVDNMAYVHADEPYRSTAHGARVRVRLPTATATALRARGYIWADNADMVEDTVDLIGSEPFRVTYVPGSAVLSRNNLEYGLSDSIVDEEGALIGHTVMDGVFPAGNQFEYVAFIKLDVRVTSGV